MSEINKDFDGVSWEWRGKTFIDLKPICPKSKCQNELNIEKTCFHPTIDRDHPEIIFEFPVSYVCPKCSFSKNTTIKNVNEPKDLRKAARKEFERRQASENTK